MPLPQLLPSDPFFADEATFSAHTAAEAQFWTTKDDAPGLIVTLPKVGYEFSNSQYVGRDPGGMFSYNKLTDIPTNGPTKFKVTTKGSGKRTYVTIVFYKDDDVVFGRFVGADPDQLAAKFGLVDTTGSGDWKQPPIGSTDAIFSKAKGSSTARIIGGALPWVAEFELPGDFVGIEIKNVKGELRYHKADRIKHGPYVRWISDHLIFFEDDFRSIDYTAYFMALNDTELTGLMPAEHQDVTVHGVQWTPPTF